MPRPTAVFLRLTLAFTVATGAAAAPAATGHLVIIGGGSRTPAILARIVELAGGPGCRIVVIPMASASPAETGESNARELRDAGCAEVDFVDFDRDTADAPEVLAALDGATGVHFSGGVQDRLLDAMAGSELLERVRAIHRDGGVISGTSAGAAVMSTIMITGDEKLHPDGAQFDTIRADNVVVREGFGFVDLAIIDQHFIARRRHNRLLSLVLEHPELVGVGIDEATAIVVSGASRFEVLGDGTVMVYDAHEAHHVAADADGDLAAHGLLLHLLRSGQGYDMQSRTVIEDGAADSGHGS